jgi:putative intracellular protease/amidase
MTTHDITSKLPVSRPEEKQSAHTGPQCLHKTGQWLSELTHAWQVFEECGFEQQLVSSNGGAVPLEPRALKFPSYDKTAKAWRDDPARMALLDSSASPIRSTPPTSTRSTSPAGTP